MMSSDNPPENYQSDPPSADDFSRSPEKDVFSWLEKNGLSHHTINHHPTFTVADSSRVKADLPGGHTKNLFMKDKKGKLVLISAWAQSELPLNRLHHAIDVQRLSFTRADLLWQSLKVTPGSVSAFALIHDVKQQVRFVVDSALMEFDDVNFHPLRCDMTTRMSRNDFEKFVTSTGRTLQIIDFSALE